MGDGEGDTGKIKVVDRRRFTSEGAPRDVPEDRQSPGDAPRESPEVPRAEATPDDSRRRQDERPAGPSARGETPPARPPSDAAAAAGSPTFLDLVAMLAQQAEMLLTGAEGFPREPTQARPFIELLAVLEQKTRGNLTPEESRALGDVLFQLQTMYVRNTR